MASDGSSLLRSLRIDKEAWTLEGTRVSRPAAIALSLAIGLLAASLSVLIPAEISAGGVPIGDIGPPMLGFERYLQGHSPYGISVKKGQLAAYPFPTMMLLSPLRFIPLPLVAPLFCGFSAAALAFAVLITGPPWRLLMMLSVPFLSTIHSVQWSMLFTAAILCAPLLPLSVAKPQLGLVLLGVGSWKRSTIGTTIALLVLSFVLLPSWPLLWWRDGALGTYTGRSPLFVLPGFLLLSAALYWRKANGRLLLLMSVIRQRYFYDQLPLFLVPRTWRQMVVLLVLSWAGALIAFAVGWEPRSGSQTLSTFRMAVISLYLPSLAMLFWQERAARRSVARE